MGNNISLEENENENGNESIQSNHTEMKAVSKNDSPGENSNNDIQSNTVKKSKRVLSDAVKKRKATSKNCNANAYKKTKSNRRR
jgi:hypothetical protein